MHRAYSLLALKTVDEAKREIVGVASTPTPDRYQDIVEPKGAVYRLPLPLLWQHDGGQPVGNVLMATATNAGIQVVARMSKIDEPGALKDRLDEAWQSVKAQLVRGLSIGFRPIESEPRPEGKGLIFKRWEWIELSCVTIPANAEATITNVKRFSQSRSHGGSVRLIRSGRNADGSVRLIRASR